MRLIPFSRAKFHTSLTLEDAIARLHAEVQTPKRFAITNSGPWDSYVKSGDKRSDFLGKKLRDGGVFVRNMNTDPGELKSNNSFQAVTRCHVYAADEHTAIEAQMRMSWFVLGFLTIWIFACLATALIGLVAAVEQSIAPWFVLLPTGMAVIVWIGACWAWSEDAKATDRLLRVNLERE